MLIIKNYLGLSKTHGIGVFAGEDIKKGQKIWSKQEGFDQIFEIKKLSHLPEIAKNYIEEYGYILDEERIILPCDNTRFINHHDYPNICNEGDLNAAFAFCDIKNGEELFCNYVDLHPTYKSLHYVGKSAGIVI